MDDLFSLLSKYYYIFLGIWISASDICCVQALRPEKVQKILDECLLTDEEMAMGVDGWKATLGDVYLDMQDDEDEEEDE